jgi:2-methylcitrate dehydratase
LAAFANGALIRYLDFNDTYLSKEPAHPSDNIAAMLAVGESVGSSGKAMLNAMVLAYEIQCRLCDAASIRSRGWDHVTYGSFSSSLLAGKLYGLDETGLIHAQGLAGTPNNAMRQTRVGELSHWKGCAFANAARNAVFAATLAHLGMTGPSEIFEGEMGFFKQVSGEFTVAPMGGEAGNTDGFMLEKTYIKHFPAEYHSQSAIEAALVLREKIPNLDDIVSIDVDSFDAAVDIIGSFAEHWAPKSRETADHSLPYCIGAALVDGDITQDSFSDTRISDPKLLALVQKIKILRDPEMNAGYPDGIPNRLRIKLANGETLSELNRYPLGHAKNPMPDADVEAKFLRQAAGMFPDSRLREILDTLWHFESIDNIATVMSLFDSPKVG